MGKHRSDALRTLSSSLRLEDRADWLDSPRLCPLTYGACWHRETMPRKQRIGYTTGVYDLFHIGHLNLLRRAKGNCDYLIVGVSVDQLVEYKGKRSVIPFEERREIVSAIRYVDRVVAQEDMDKIAAWERLKFDVMFVGDDWKGTEKWNRIESELNERGVELIYFSYTKGTSSTLINETLMNLRLGSSR